MSDVDINSLDLLNEPVEVDGSVNSEAFFRPPLPDDGDHLAILKLGDRGIKIDRQREGESRTKSGKPFLQVHLAMELIDDTGKKTGTVFDQVTSVLMPNTGTTKLHAILDLAGDPAPARCTLGDLLAHTERVIAQAPQVIVTTQWEARGEDTSKPEGSKDRYYTVLKGQRKFPPVVDESGQVTEKYESEIDDPKSGEKARAQVRVVRYKRAS
jgi:hypothetical protein